jgi:hypothetical protein
MYISYGYVKIHNIYSTESIRYKNNNHNNHIMVIIINMP